MKSLTQTHGYAPFIYSWLVLLGLGLLIGVYGSIRLLTDGTIVLGTSDQLPWGILISTYVFFVLISSGICIGICPMATVFRSKKYEPLVKRGTFLCIISLIAGGTVIVLSLGQTFRILYLISSPSLSSPMWWMIVFYGLYMGALLVEFYLLEYRGIMSRPVAIVALIAPLMAAGTLGAIFGFVDARPYFGGFYGPVYLIVTALLSGLAAIIVVTTIEKKATNQTITEPWNQLLTKTLGKYLALLLGGTIVLVGWKVLTGLTATAPATAAAYEYMMFGPPAWWYIGIGLLFGLIVPFFMVFIQRFRSLQSVFIASTLVLIGMFVTRLEFVIGGQIVALTQDPSLEWPFVSYAPTAFELSIVVFGFAIFGLLYTVGYVMFDFDKLPVHAEDQETDEGGLAQYG